MPVKKMSYHEWMYRYEKGVWYSEEEYEAQKYLFGIVTNFVVDRYGKAFGEDREFAVIDESKKNLEFALRDGKRKVTVYCSNYKNSIAFAMYNGIKRCIDDGSENFVLVLDALADLDEFSNIIMAHLRGCDSDEVDFVRWSSGERLK